MPVSHNFNCVIADDTVQAAEGFVLPSHWNDSHAVTITGAEIEDGSITLDKITGLGALATADVPVTVDTKANILASTPSYNGTLAYSTDTYEFWEYNSGWRKSPFALVSETSSPDMGWTQSSSRIGYGTDYITDKTISNSAIGGNVTTTTGAVRVSSGTFQIYLNGSWNDVVVNFRFREDANEDYQLEHNPIGFSDYYTAAGGNGLTLGVNGLPLVQNYSAVMGANGVPLLISGGVF